MDGWSQDGGNNYGYVHTMSFPSVSILKYF